MTNNILLDEYSNVIMSSFITVGQKVNIKFHLNDILKGPRLTVRYLSKGKTVTLYRFPIL